ncbi:beta-lactoglobulin-like [Sorex araneus]|uniref:beta-lactoglobulin-like n=1 Tax=Sorex araneus TaxID=42254 RepID=UPI002433967D|nr:beta-lactoglobulin-like [Sorex araneus]
MKCVLLALALVCGIQATTIPQAMKNLDISKMAGTWHTVAMMTTDTALLASETTPLRMFVKELSITPKGLEITVNQRKNGQCVEKKIVAEKTDMEARFKIHYLQQDEMFVMDFDNQDHLIFCMEKTMDTQSLTCQYLTRTPSPNQDKVMEKFNSVLKAKSVRPTMVLDFTQTMMPCRA